MIIYYSAVRWAGPAVRNLIDTAPPSLMSSYNDLRRAGVDTEAFWAFMAIHRVRSRDGDGGKSRGVSQVT